MLISKRKDVFDRYFKDPYLQHNPSLPAGTAAVKAWKEQNLGDVRVTFFRIIAEGDIIVFHQILEDFPPMPDAFAVDIYRLSNGKIVEHWDAIEQSYGGLLAGEMISGPCQVMDLEKTDINRTIARNFVEEVLIGRKYGVAAKYVSEDLIQHSPLIGKGLPNFIKFVKTGRSVWERFSRVVCEGNFVWTFCEGKISTGGTALYMGGFEGESAVLYDLWRLENEKIVEHWSIRQGVPSVSTSGLPVLFE